MLSESEKYIIACMCSAKLRNDKAQSFERAVFYKKGDPRRKLIEERNTYLNSALAECKKVYHIAYVPIRPYEELIGEQYQILKSVLYRIRKNQIERAA